MKLVPSTRERAPNVLCTGFPGFRRFVEQSARFRFASLRHAVSDAGNTLVWGTPVPPLPGWRLVEEHGIAIPCGRAWSPAVDAAVLRTMLRVRDGELLLFEEAATYERLDIEDFVTVTRSSVRITGKEWPGA